MPVTPQDMLELAKLIKQLCGVALDDSKGYLIESRLSQLATEAGCASYVDLCRRAVAGDRQTPHQGHRRHHHPRDARSSATARRSMSCNIA